MSTPKRLFLTRAPWERTAEYFLSDKVLELEKVAGSWQPCLQDVVRFFYPSSPECKAYLRMTGPLAPGEFVELGVVNEEEG